MNKTKIEYADYTWNPVTGCFHNCAYCYAKRIAERFKSKNQYPYIDGIKPKNIKEPFPYGFLPTFHYDRLQEPLNLKTPSIIFVCSMSDLFGQWVPTNWILQIINIVKQCPQHIFLFLTKNPNRYFEFKGLFPDNCWLGASITSNEQVIQNTDGSYIVTDAHSISDTMSFFKNSFLSIDPLLTDIAEDLPIAGIDWVIVGAQTGPKAVKPEKKWIENLIELCQEAGVSIFLKNNLHWHTTIQEFPQKMINYLKNKRQKEEF